MLSIKLKSPPFSINKATYRNGNRTVRCRNWGDSILKQLKQYEKEMDAFHDLIQEDVDNVGLDVSITFFMPNLYTKTGKVSRLSNDLSNVEKMLIDLIFDSRFKDRGWSNLNTDDCLITALHSYKVYSSSYLISVDISIVKSR